jgi:hypothetical protein
VCVCVHVSVHLLIQINNKITVISILRELCAVSRSALKRGDTQFLVYCELLCLAVMQSGQFDMPFSHNHQVESWVILSPRGHNPNTEN